MLLEVHNLMMVDVDKIIVSSVEETNVFYLLACFLVSCYVFMLFNTSKHDGNIAPFYIYTQNKVAT